MPRLSLASYIDPYSVCSDTGVVEAYIADPFNHGRVTTRWFSEYMKAIERVKLEAKQISTPIAIWHGDGDALVAPWVSDEFFKRLSTPHRQRKVVSSALHEILLEPSWRETLQDIKNWLEQF